MQSFAEFLIPQGAGCMEAMLNTSACISTGQLTLGDGVFAYQGVRDPVYQTFTVWRMSMYGVVTAMIAVRRGYIDLSENS